MAKAKVSTDLSFRKKAKKKGVAAKTKTSTLKSSKLYKKPYKDISRETIKEISTRKDLSQDEKEALIKKEKLKLKLDDMDAKEYTLTPPKIIELLELFKKHKSRRQSNLLNYNNLQKNKMYVKIQKT
jgi:hypothetical protein